MWKNYHWYIMRGRFADYLNLTTSFRFMLFSSSLVKRKKKSKRKFSESIRVKQLGRRRRRRRRRWRRSVRHTRVKLRREEVYRRRHSYKTFSPISANLVSMLTLLLPSYKKGLFIDFFYLLDI